MHWLYVKVEKEGQAAWRSATSISRAILVSHLERNALGPVTQQLDNIVPVVQLIGESIRDTNLAARVTVLCRRKG